MGHSKQWVFFFGGGESEGDPAMTHTLGGKGAGLAAMTRAALPVPPGFTISSDCCRHFLDHDETWPDGLEEQVRRNLARLEETTGRTFGDANDPLLLAVRSGAEVSMPGMMDTILNCGLASDGQSAWGALVNSINAVFRSWNTSRAVAYRKRHDIRGLPGTAATVQAMVPSQVSGVLFTRDPSDPSADQMIIESSFGLGEAVVSGRATPDRFVVTREGFECVQSCVGGKRSLSSEQIAKLSELGLRVEELLGVPADIEWGWTEGGFALLQRRPIRGFDIAEDTEAGRRAEIARLRGLAGRGRRVWVAHNLGETLRHPTPLTWDIVSRFMSGSGGFGLMYRDLGYRPSRIVCKHGFLELICGRVYADPDRLAQLFWAHAPLAYDADAVQQNASLLGSAPTTFDAERTDPWLLLQLPSLAWALLRSSRILKQARRTAQTDFEERHLPGYLEYVSIKRKEDLTSLSTSDVISELHDRRGRVLERFGKECLKPGYFGGMALVSLENRLGELMGRAEGCQLARALTSGLEGDLTVEQNALLHRVAAEEATMDEFLERFGHRAIDEMELAEPRWREDPAHLERVTSSIQTAPQGSHAESASRRHAAERELPDVLARWGGSCFREEVEEDLHLAQTLLPYRETGKHYLMMGYELIRQAIMELSRRWGLGRDVFFLCLDELERFESEDFAARLGERKIRWRSAQRLDMPEVIDSDDLDRLGLPREYEAAAELQGQPLASGVATGVARIVHDPRDATRLGADYVLVCPSTDPAWATLFVNARGLVVERGGVLSHGAIVARDMGIPAVVCPGATSRIRDGGQIRIDGAQGTIALTETEGRPAEDQP